MRRDDRAGATREALLNAAERLYAERGVHAVANREISQAAGQGNNAAVTYHFGTKADVVRAIARRHAGPVGRRRETMMAAAAGSTDIRDWVACLVLPLTEHLAELGNPTWYARFTAQVRADPAYSPILTEESVDITPALLGLQANLARCLPALPARVRDSRAVMAWGLVTQVAVDHEKALAAGGPTAYDSWEDVAAGLVDAIAGMWQAPIGPRPGA